MKFIEPSVQRAEVRMDPSQKEDNTEYPQKIKNSTEDYFRLDQLTGSKATEISGFFSLSNSQAILQFMNQSALNIIIFFFAKTQLFIYVQMYHFY